MDFLQNEYFGNTLLDYAATLLIIVIGIIIIFAIKTLVFYRLEKKAKQTQNKFDDFLVHILGKTLMPALYFGVIAASLQHLELTQTFEKILTAIGIILVTFFGARFLIAMISYTLVNFWAKQIASSEEKTRSIKAVMPVVKVIIYGVGLFFLLDNFGIKISALAAGLGIGGVAMALAGQAVLADLFSYFAILFDRPFEIGDFIIINEYMGTIEHVGIKTTRIRSLGGEQLVFSNSDLTNSRVRNYKRMQQRRVVFQLGVTYQTPSEKLKEVPKMIQSIIESVEDTRFDRSHFANYGDFSLNFETVYYIFGSDYNKYMDIQQKINLAIYEGFEKAGIEFAYPTQTLFVNQENTAGA